MRLMVDWLTARIQPSLDWLDHLSEDERPPPIFDTGRVMKLGPGGEIEWQAAARLEVPGSHDNRLHVASPDGFGLRLEGNPVKFFQGHNLFGSDDALALYFEAAQAVRQVVGYFPSPATWESNEYSGPSFNRLDITRSYRFPTQSEAREWLRDVAATAKSRHGHATLSQGTVYFGKHSRRWSLKVYAKADEIMAKGKTHRISAKVMRSLSPRECVLHEWAQGVLRFELVLRGMELKKWGTVEPRVLPEIWQRYYDSIEWNRNSAVISEGLDMVDKAKLSNANAGYMARWNLGEDLRAGLSKPTFYLVRREILDAVGVDIAMAPVKPERSKDRTSPVMLDAKGWDPEPLESYVFQPDQDLPLRYGVRK